MRPIIAILGVFAVLLAAAPAPAQVSTTRQLGLTKPAADQSLYRGKLPHEVMNDNLDAIDNWAARVAQQQVGQETDIESLAAQQADLPETYVATATLNSTSGVVISLPKPVTDTTDYEAVPVLDGADPADVGTLSVVKSTSSCTVYNSGTNTTDTVRLLISYAGEKNLYGASVRRRWIPAVTAGVDHATDTGDAGTLETGSIADILAYLCDQGISHTRLQLAGNHNYQLRDDLTVPTGITLEFDDGAQIVTSIELAAGNSWTQRRGSKGYCYTGATINKPGRIAANGVELTPGKVSSLARGEWAWFRDQLCVRLPGDEDPDSHPAGWVQAGYTLTVNGGINAGLYQVFSGMGTVTGSPRVPHMFTEWFGAAGDDSTDDTDAFKRAIALSGGSGVPIRIVGNRTYKLTETLDLNDGSPTQGTMLCGEGYNLEPVLKFYNCAIGLKTKSSRSVSLRHIKVDMTQSPMPCIGILANGLWDVGWENVIVRGPDKVTAPTKDRACIGILLRATYTVGDYTPSSIPELDFVDELENPERFGMGVYWNDFRRLDVSGFSYGLFLAGREGTSSAVNQNSFTSCKINGNYHDIWLDGIGGGITFISCTAENATGDAVHVERVSSGTGPVWIGGELRGIRQWVGPGLLLNAVAGTRIMNANDSGNTGTLMRFIDQGAQLYGTKLNSSFISGWDTKQDVPLTGNGTTSSKMMDIATFTSDTRGTDACVYEISCILTDGSTPQGTSCLVYHLNLNRAGRKNLSSSLTEVSNRTVWNNLGGGRVAPTLKVKVVGNTATVTANLNWNGSGRDPGESRVHYSIREILAKGDFTVTRL